MDASPQTRQQDRINAFVEDCLRGRADEARVKDAAQHADDLLNAYNSHGATALLCAVQENHRQLVSLLVKYQADVQKTLRTDDGYNPLMAAAINSEGPEITKILLTAGADPSVGNFEGKSVVEWAEEKDNDGFAQALREHQAKAAREMAKQHLANAIAAGDAARVDDLLDQGQVTLADGLNEAGSQALVLAGLYGKLELCERFLQRGADVNMRNENGTTALSTACAKGDAACAELLLGKGADINLAKHNGRTPLHMSCQKGHTACVELLLGKGAGINLVDEKGVTPLSKAAENGYCAIVRKLLLGGADQSPIDKNGINALEWAQKRGHSSVLAILSNPPPAKSTQAATAGGGGGGGGGKTAAEKAAAEKAAAQKVAAETAPGAQPPIEEAEPPYAAELGGLSFNMLKRRAKALGATDAQLEDLDDEDDVMAAAVALVLSLRHALDGMKMKALKDRLRAIGATEQQIEDLGDGTSPKVAAIALILDIASADPGGAAAPSKALAATEPEPQPEPVPGVQESHGQRILSALGADQDFHLVFSNKTNWDALCLEVRGKLALGGVRIWQQRTNIPKDSDNWFSEWYPSAVRARKIVCFISVDYLKSPYCMKEWRVAESKNKLLVVACEPLSQIAAVDPSAFPHASNALAYLDGGGQVIFNGQDDVVAEIRKFLG